MTHPDKATQAEKARAPDPRSDKTREALLHATVSLGAKYGFDNISIRQIAKEADANLASVTYHFGSKDGLRDAVIDFAGTYMRDYGPGKILREAIAKDITTLSPDEAKQIIRKIMIMAIRGKNEDNAMADLPTFIHREVFHSGEASKHFYNTVFCQELDLMCALVARITGDPPHAQQTRLRALTIIGQSVFMSLAESLIHTAMEWDDYGEEELEQLAGAFWVTP